MTRRRHYCRIAPKRSTNPARAAKIQTNTPAPRAYIQTHVSTRFARCHQSIYIRAQARCAVYTHPRGRGRWSGSRTCWAGSRSSPPGTPACSCSSSSSFDFSLFFSTSSPPRAPGPRYAHNSDAHNSPRRTGTHSAAVYSSLLQHSAAAAAHPDILSSARTRCVLLSRASYYNRARLVDCRCRWRMHH